MGFEPKTLVPHSRQISFDQVCCTQQGKANISTWWSQHPTLHYWATPLVIYNHLSLRPCISPFILSATGRSLGMSAKEEWRISMRIILLPVAETVPFLPPSRLALLIPPSRHPPSPPEVSDVSATDSLTPHYGWYTYCREPVENWTYITGMHDHVIVKGSSNILWKDLLSVHVYIPLLYSKSAW